MPKHESVPIKKMPGGNLEITSPPYISNNNCIKNSYFVKTMYITL